jgi:hypothetical protein
MRGVVSPVGPPLFDKNEAAPTSAFRVQIKNGMPGGSRTRKWIQNDALWRTPQLDDLLEELERLDRIEPVIATHDG